MSAPVFLLREHGCITLRVSPLANPGDGLGLFWFLPSFRVPADDIQTLRTGLPDLIFSPASRLFSRQSAGGLRERGVRRHGCRHDRGCGHRDQGEHQSEENENLAHDRPPFPLSLLCRAAVTICDPHHEIATLSERERLLGRGADLAAPDLFNVFKE
jgi:hypothetical protein